MRDKIRRIRTKISRSVNPEEKVKALNVFGLNRVSTAYGLIKSNFNKD